MKLDQFPGVNAGYVLELYEKYRQNPESVDPATRRIFEGWTPTESAAPAGTPAAPVETLQAVSRHRQSRRVNPPLRPSCGAHRSARIHPDRRSVAVPGARTGSPTATSSGFPPRSWADRSQTASANAYDAIGKLRERLLLDHRLRLSPTSSCRKNASGCATPSSQARFLPPLDESNAEALLDRLTQVEVFERFLHRTFPGKTRFSVEGLDMLIPVLDEILCGAADQGIRHTMLGMAHRGRLNVLAHVLDKPYSQILAEFKDPVQTQTWRVDLGWMGDVKYHAGARTEAPRGEMFVAMAPNPSHLEAVNPVVVGMARAAGTNASSPGAPVFDGGVTLPILIHGDMAFPGQGIVAETLNLSRLPGYDTGGTLHIIANNQLGFTATPGESYSTSYTSGIARGFKIPIVHVNADDPVACLEAARLSWEYRERFRRDFLIDLVGYRRYGHNEGDEPAFTQPLMYKTISSHLTVRELLAQTLVKEGKIPPERPDAADQEAFRHSREGVRRAQARRGLHRADPRAGAARDRRQDDNGSAARPPARDQRRARPHA